MKGKYMRFANGASRLRIRPLTIWCGVLLVTFCVSLFASQEAILLKKGKGGSNANARIEKIEPSALEAALPGIHVGAGLL